MIRLRGSGLLRHCCKSFFRLTASGIGSRLHPRARDSTISHPRPLCPAGSGLQLDISAIRHLQVCRQNSQSCMALLHVMITAATVMTMTMTTVMMMMMM